MIAVLRTGGKLAQFSPPDELLSSPADDFVEDFLGTDRGVRRLSFFPTDGLPLTSEPVITVDSSAEQVAERAKTDAPYLLLNGADGRPLGWVEREDAASGGAGVARENLVPHGRPFEFGRESLRDALDCSVLSPTGWAVAVDGEGRTVGVISQEAIGLAIRGAHAERRGTAGISKVGA